MKNKMHLHNILSTTQTGNQFPSKSFSINITDKTKEYIYLQRAAHNALADQHTGM